MRIIMFIDDLTGMVMLSQLEEVSVTDFNESYLEETNYFFADITTDLDTETDTAEPKRTALDDYYDCEDELTKDLEQADALTKAYERESDEDFLR